jgi:hypothetical protein
VTKLDQLRLQVRQLSQRIAALEQSPVPAPARSRRRKPRYVGIDPQEHLGRVRLFGQWQLLRRAQCAGKKFNRRKGDHAPWTVEWFCANVRDSGGLYFSVREVWRWLSDHNTHAPGSRQDRRITAAIKAQIAAMIANGVRLSHGT